MIVNETSVPNKLIYDHECIAYKCTFSKLFVVYIKSLILFIALYGEVFRIISIYRFYIFLGLLFLRLFSPIAITPIAKSG